MNHITNDKTAQSINANTHEPEKHDYYVIPGDVNSIHNIIMRELNMEQMIILRDKLIRRTPAIK
jgi:hypothetical protein